MDKRFISHNADTGISEFFHFDSMTGDVHIEHVQDTTGIIDGNIELANDDDYTKKGIKDDMWHYANIPVIVQQRWLNEYGRENWPMLPNNKQLLFRLLNSPEWKYLKTTSKLHISKP